MQGRILEVDPVRGGLILGNDGNRYGFQPADWRAATPPAAGIGVDFVAAETMAREIFPLPGQQPHQAFTLPPNYNPQPGYTPPQPGYAQQPGPGYTAPAPRPSDSSTVLGWIGIACLALGFIIPILPIIAAFILGLVGADIGKRNHNSTGIVLSRIAWIGALALTVAGIAFIIFAFQIAGSMAGVDFSDMFNSSWWRNMN